nr:9672_t:CDS:2 [Entrophospora candida]
MMISYVKWLPYDENETYNLTLMFPNINPFTRENNKKVKQVAICNGCKNEKSRRYPPILVPIPAAIQNVPMLHCKYLLPVHMNCSLGHAAGSNPYTSYVHLKGQINITHNYHALKLYSGTTGAFLNANEPSQWFHEALIPASNWLRQNNRLIKKYATDVNITHPLPGEPKYLT